jgi:hypothetical protein
MAGLGNWDNMKMEFIAPWESVRPFVSQWTFILAHQSYSFPLVVVTNRPSPGVIHPIPLVPWELWRQMMIHEKMFRAAGSSQYHKSRRLWRVPGKSDFVLNSSNANWFNVLATTRILLFFLTVKLFVNRVFKVALQVHPFHLRQIRSWLASNRMHFHVILSNRSQFCLMFRFGRFPGQQILN